MWLAGETWANRITEDGEDGVVCLEVGRSTV